MAGGPLDFLNGLKPVERRRSAAPQAERPPFVFLLEHEDGELMLKVADRGGRPTMVDAKDYPGPMGDVLDMMAELRASGAFVWFGGADTPWRISIDAHPELLPLLFLCDNVVDTKMRPLRRAGVKADIELELTDADGDMVVPRLTLTAAGERHDDFMMLSATMAAAGGMVYDVPGGVGDNYRNLGIFVQPFRRDSLENYLAIFLTYVENVRVDYGGRGVVIHHEAVKAVPTVVIDKIDVDQALYMHMTSTRPDGDEDVAPTKLTPLYEVRIGGGGRIVARPLELPDIDEKCAELSDFIKSFAPDRASKQSVYNDGELFIVPADVASEFLLRGLPELLRDYRVVGIDKLRRYKLRPVSPRIRLNMSSGIDFLEGGAEVEVGDVTITLQDLLDQYARNKYITLPGGERGVIDARFVRRVERLFKPAGKDGYTVSFFDLPEVERMLDAASAQAPALQRPREFYAGFNRLAGATLELNGVDATLRPYQSEGVKWLKYLYDNGMGGCLADDMGLGKTLQIISLITMTRAKAEGPVLVVMPRSLLFNWQAELARFAPHLSVYTYYGTERDSDRAMGGDVVLTTYALVRNDIGRFAKLEFDTVVLDESQTIKNVTSMQTRSVYLLRAKHRFAVSGTPIENNLTELYSLFRFLNPAMFGSLDDFNRRYAIPIQRDDDGDTAEALRRKIFPFMLRRLKADVLTDLPDRVQQTLYVDMDDAQRRLYRMRLQHYKERIDETVAAEGLPQSRIIMLKALTELRRLASVPDVVTDGSVASPKIELLAERIQSAVDNGHKVVVFFNFIAGIELLGERLLSSGIIFEQMTGATSDRQRVVERFQSDAECRVLLMTLKTGGVGLNLTAADIVFIAEPWWNRSAENQAIDRLHRIGQKSTVFSFSLITRDTIEEKIEQLQQKKADLFDSVIGNDAASLKAMTKEDIDFLLS